MLPKFKCRLASRLRANVRLRNLLHGMKAGPVLLLRLFYGTNLSAKGSELANAVCSFGVFTDPSPVPGGP